MELERHIEDYALIGDTQSVALVGRSGSIDWLCLPRFDSAACFAALLGGREQGQFSICPVGDARVTRRYRGDTLILETDFETDSGRVRLVDSMPIRGKYPDVVRIIQGLSGEVAMRVELTIRFDYGNVLPWVQRLDGRLHAIAGPDALVLVTPVKMRGEGFHTIADVTVRAGQEVPFVLTWHPSHEPPPETAEPFSSLAETEQWWTEWTSAHAIYGPYRAITIRSLLTLKALTYAPTGAIVAAGTTSLPESIGGERNWDYRFAWLRDATFTLYALMHAGYTEEAKAWRDWLLRAVAGDPAKLQPLYGPAGERRMTEQTLEWLPGFAGSRPVRIGNNAAHQYQLDIYGEVLDTLHQGRRMGLGTDENAWAVQRAIADWLETHWDVPDQGLWEMRGTPRHFVHSKVMAWVAFDRLVKAIEQQGLEGPVDRWRHTRAEIHDEVCRRGFDPDLGSFTQSYGSKELDASLLLIPSVGFLPKDDPRVRGTIEAVERRLVRGGFVARYLTSDAMNIDGLIGREGAFIAASFWLVDALALIGRQDDARALFEQTIALANDVGLLSEEYDVDRKQLIGNFPQAFSHVAVVNSALALGGRTALPLARHDT